MLVHPAHLQQVAQERADELQHLSYGSCRDPQPFDTSLAVRYPVGSVRRLLRRRSHAPADVAGT